MKKVFMGAVVFGALALTSCKADYKCTTTVAGVEEVERYDNLTKDQAEEQEKECESGLVSGVWSLD